jgi:putative tryptophan/tyrosine transport system substrate-binding protein
MRCRAIAIVAVALALASVGLAEAQQPKITRIGFLSATPASAIPDRIEAFRQGMRELGYVEGKNILIEYRWAEGKIDRLSQLAAELVQLNLKVIVAAGPQATRRVKDATSEIPIVMGFHNDPIGSGLVASLARPGGNVTGMSTLAPEISGKQLELLQEIVPKLSRVAVVGNSTDPGNSQVLSETERAAGALGVQHLYIDARSPEDIENAFRKASKSRADAVLALPSFLLTSQRKQIVDLALKTRLPAIYDRREFVEDGGLLSYSVSSTDLFRRAAYYVDKILKGAKPADLPVEQPTKFELVINLKAAKQIGLTISPNVLARADKVIK